MKNASFTKGSTVEVTSDDPGFNGAWYVATLLDEVKASPTKNNRNGNQIGSLVKYDTLLKEDSLDEPLTEIVHPSFVRPLPPRNLRRGNGRGGDFELYDVIDAYHREGWWIGVVKKVIVKGKMRKYVVSFENPPEEVQFERRQMRLHVDWIDRRWQLPPKKESNSVDALVRSSGNKRIMKLVEENSHGKRFRSSAGSKGNTKVMVSMKEKMRSDATHQDSPLTEHGIITPESNSETVGAVDASVRSSRNKRIMKPVEENAHGKRFRSSAGSKGNTKVTVSVKEKRRSDAIHQNAPLIERGIITPETRKSEDGASHQKRKRGRPPKLLAKRPSTQASVTSVGTTDYQQDWPFIKRSPIWATIASLDLYQTPPQKPHFSPLKKFKEVNREGLAIAHMVTFANVVQMLSDLKLTDPIDLITNSLETLVDLETHGFDVGAIRGRLLELLSLKSQMDQHEDRLKKVEEEIEKCNGEKSLEVEMNELEVKMQELQEKMAQIETMKKVKEEEIMRLQSNLHLVSEQISDWEVAFKKLAATPL